MTIRTIEFQRDVYIIRPLGRTGWLAANDGYGRLQHIDVTGARETTHIDFPGDDPHFAIHGWYVAPDGAWSVALSHDAEVGLRFDHRAREASSFEVLPTMGTPTAWAWYGQNFQISTSDRLCWGLHDGRLTTQPPAEDFVAWGERMRASHPELQDWGTLRHDTAQDLVYLLRPDRKQVAIVEVATGKVVKLAPEGTYVSLLWRPDHILIGRKQTIDRVDPTGRVDRFELAGNETLVAMWDVMAESRRHLTVLSRLSSYDMRLLIFHDELT